VRPVGMIESPDESMVRKIQKIFTDLEDGFHQQDADAFDRHFSQDAVQVTAAGVRMEGWNEIHRYHKERLEGHAHGLTVSLKVENIGSPAPNVAIVHTVQETTTSDSGVRRNSGTWTLVERNGDWWICSVQQTNIVDLPPDWSARADPES
jgi:uncharacterized protein (TIGR02246 family)